MADNRINNKVFAEIKAYLSEKTVEPCEQDTGTQDVYDELDIGKIMAVAEFLPLSEAVQTIFPSLFLDEGDNKGPIASVSNESILQWLEKKQQNAHSFTRTVRCKLEDKGYKNDYPRFYNKAEIDRRLFSKIVSEAYSYHPDIKTVFKIIIGLELGIEEAEEMLYAASYSFGSSTFNLIIRYCIEHSEYNYCTIDPYLYEFCNDTLYSLR